MGPQQKQQQRHNPTPFMPQQFHPYTSNFHIQQKMHPPMPRKEDTEIQSSYGQCQQQKLESNDDFKDAINFSPRYQRAQGGGGGGGGSSATPNLPGDYQIACTTITRTITEVIAVHCCRISGRDGSR